MARNKPIAAIFIENKYKNWYDTIIARAQVRGTLEGYCERHHILPRSLMGNNEETNLVKLTPREHFLVHWLLIKFTDGLAQKKMHHALHRMVQGLDCLAGWQYERARLGAKDALKGVPKTAEHREKLSVARKKRAPPSEYTRQLLREALIERGCMREKSPEHREKIRVSMLGKIPSEETLKKIKLKNTGRKRSDETRKRISESITLWHANRINSTSSS